MDPRLNVLQAQEHIADLRRSADASRQVAGVTEQPKRTPVIALRVAGADEADELARLAALDSAPPLRGTALVAVVDGRLVAAISLADGRVIADPLAPSAEARSLLYTRAVQLVPPVPRRPWRRFRPRFA